MELNIKLIVSDNLISVIDQSTSYLEENNNDIILNQFKKSDVLSMTFASLNKIDKEEVITFNTGNTLTIDKDGWLKIYYLILPTKKWFLKMFLNPISLGIYNIVYYTHNNKIYWYLPSTKDFGEVIKLEEILDIAQLPNVKTTISITSEDLISICNLQKCYINLCLQIFEGQGFTQCWNKNNIDSELIYKRDLVLMALNVIKYMAECNQLYEVERIIELMHSCNGVCNNQKSINNDNKCGCS